MNQLPDVDGCLVVAASERREVAVLSNGSLYFGIPPCDREEFGQLPYEVGQAVLLRLCWMRTIHNAKKKATACHALVCSPGFPLSYDRLRTLYYDFKRDGDWRVLLDSRKAPKSEEPNLSKKFLQFVKGLYDENQRKFAPAHVELLTIWRTHHTSLGKLVKAIPGYKEWPVAEPDTDMPAGWHYTTLQRKVRDKFAEAITSEGRTAAARFRPQVPTTREHLKVGQRVFGDDQWYDVEVNFLGISRQSLRPLGLDLLDHCSGSFIAHGFRPRLRNEITGVQQSIRLEESKWMCVHWLTNIGFRNDTGSVMVHEHGTYNFSDEFKDLVRRLTQGAVDFDASGFTGNPAFAGQFEGQSKGNFKYKAPLESAYNLVRNRQAQLQGATGHDRKPPEQLYGLKQYNDRLLKAWEALPPERRKLLTFPILDWHEFIFLALHFYDAIDTRTEHNLQGWQRLGYIAHEYRLALDPNGWRPMEELAMFSVEQRNAILALLDTDPNFKQTRKLSPREVWNAHKHELTRLPDSLVGTLLGPADAKIATVTDEGYFRLQDQELDPEPILYLARLNGELLPRGEEYLVFQNPFQPDRLIVHEKARARKSDSGPHASGLGGYIGTSKLWGREDVLDVDALQRRCGEVAKIEAAELAPIAKRGADLIRKRIERSSNNAAVLAGKPVTLEEKAAARILKGAIKTAPDALDVLPNNELIDSAEGGAPDGYSISEDELNALPST